VWFNNHYQFMSSLWQTYAVRFDAKSALIGKHLERARSVTDHTGSVDFFRAAENSREKKVHEDGTVTYPENQRQSGRFRHTKGFTQWGNKAEGDYNAHASDPAGLRLAWAVGGDRWAHEGYKLWRSNLCSDDLDGTRQLCAPKPDEQRHVSQNIFNLIDLALWDRDWYGRLKCREGDPLRKPCWNQQHQTHTNSNEDQLHTNADVLRDMVSDLGSMDWATGTTPLWNPLWPTRYHQLGLSANSEWLESIGEKWRSDHIGIYHKNSSPALAALLTLENNDPQYLTRFYYLFSKYPYNVYRNPGHPYHGFGLGPGELDDMHYPLQWPCYLHALLQMDVRIPDLKWSGQYPAHPHYVIIAHDVEPDHENTDVALRRYMDNGEDPGLGDRPVPGTGSLPVYAGGPATKLDVPHTDAAFLLAIKSWFNMASCGDTSLTATYELVRAEGYTHGMTSERSKRTVLRFPVCKTSSLGVSAYYFSRSKTYEMPYNMNGDPEVVFLPASDNPRSLNTNSSSMLPIGAQPVTLSFKTDLTNSSRNIPISIRLTDKYGVASIDTCLHQGITLLPREGLPVELTSERAPYRLDVYSSYAERSDLGSVKLEVLSGDLLMAASDRDLCEVLKRITSQSSLEYEPCPR
jgi:hypothetical protein